MVLITFSAPTEAPVWAQKLFITTDSGDSVITHQGGKDKNYKGVKSSRNKKVSFVNNLF
jgi:hypothetical protein